MVLKQWRSKKVVVGMRGLFMENVSYKIKPMIP